MRVPDYFLSAIDSDPGNCVLVVGSGLSKRGVREHGRGLPDWDELMVSMVQEIEQRGLCTQPGLIELRAMLVADPPEYLDIAQRFRDALAHDPDGYEGFLRRHLQPPDLVESNVHKLILSIGFRGILSYNFDLVFERQSPSLRRIVYPMLLDQIGHFQRKGFFAKIHGSIDMPATNLVLTRQSYENLSRHRNYSALLNAIFLAHKTLCVGFSLRDPDFQRILEDLKTCFGHGLPLLYALMRDPGGKVRSDWRGKGVEILPYRDHRELPGFFMQLAALPASREHRGQDPMGESVLSVTSHGQRSDPGSAKASGIQAPNEEGWERRVKEALNKTVSFDFVETPFQDVIAFLSSLADVTMVLDMEALRGGPHSVTLRVSDMRLESALKWVLRIVGLSYALEDEAILISRSTPPPHEPGGHSGQLFG